MSQELAEPSNSDKSPRKKKKYLYLDKFEDYKKTNDDRLDIVESSQLRIAMVVSIVFAAIICVALIWGLSSA